MENGILCDFMPHDVLCDIKQSQSYTFFNKSQVIFLKPIKHTEM
jgi:hypothetical protein